MNESYTIVIMKFYLGKEKKERAVKVSSLMYIICIFT